VAAEQQAQSLAAHLRGATDALAKLKHMVRAEKAARAAVEAAAAATLRDQVTPARSAPRAFSCERVWLDVFQIFA
jgi:hypothetical protein